MKKLCTVCNIKWCRLRLAPHTNGCRICESRLVCIYKQLTQVIYVDKENMAWNGGFLIISLYAIKCSES